LRVGGEINSGIKWKLGKNTLKDFVETNVSLLAQGSHSLGNQKCRAGVGCWSVVELLPSMCEALDPTPSITIKHRRLL
jgi:hypothetical protein